MLSEGLRNLPYLVHTNRELGLMLKGIKPLAIFGGRYEGFPECMIRYLRMFDKHVESGRFVKREYVMPISVPELPFKGIHYVLYALPHEEWRIDAMIEFRNRPVQKWSREREREFGELLGYEDWQNEAWLNSLPPWEDN
jgi:hypothetical protein